jgi:hypothetical protein
MIFFTQNFDPYLLHALANYELLAKGSMSLGGN